MISFSFYLCFENAVQNTVLLLRQKNPERAVTSQFGCIIVTGFTGIYRDISQTLAPPLFLTEQSCRFLFLRILCTVYTTIIAWYKMVGILYPPR